MTYSTTDTLETYLVSDPFQENIEKGLARDESKTWCYVAMVSFDRLFLTENKIVEPKALIVTGSSAPPAPL